jgi:uncharacterized YccA/Bax inhibitor family protein
MSNRRRGFFESSNPILNEDRFKRSAEQQQNYTDGPISRADDQSMTTMGAINKSVMLTGILILTAAYSFGNMSMALLWGGAIGGLIMVLIATFKPTTAPVTAPLYAGFEGLFVGSISAIYANAYGGIIFNAVSITICILLAMLMVYRSGLIKVDNKFRKGVMIATGGILLVYLFAWIMRMVGMPIPYLHQGGTIGIIISVVIIGIASLNLMLDFDFFEKGEQYGAPKHMEWLAALGLMVTLVWIYVEVLRLLSILNRD